MAAVEAGRAGDRLGTYAAAYGLLTVTLCGFVWGFITCAGKIRTHVSHDIRHDAFERLQDLSFSFYDTRPVGWLMARLTADCQRLSNILAWGVMDFIWGTALMVGISAVMLVYHWQLALAVLTVVPALFAVSVYFRKRILTHLALGPKDEFADYGVVQRSDHGCADVQGAAWCAPTSTRASIP